MDDALIIARLTGDAALVALVGTFDERPCIFADPIVPEGAPRPYVWLQQPSSNVDWGGKVHTGRETARDIWVVVDNTGTWAPAQAIAETVLALLHRKPLSGGVIADVSGPIRIDSDESVCVLGLTLTHKRVA